MSSHNMTKKRSSVFPTPQMISDQLSAAAIVSPDSPFRAAAR
jgi:hypothetical protein